MMTKSPNRYIRLLFCDCIILTTIILYLYPRTLLALVSKPLEKPINFPNEKIITEACTLVSNPDSYQDEFHQRFNLSSFDKVGSIIDDITQIQGFIDINNDGVDDKVMNSIEGTAHVKHFNAIDLKTNKEISITYTDDQEDYSIYMGWDNGYIRWLRYQNYTFLLNGRSAKTPDRLWYVAANNHAYRMCDFKLSNKLKYPAHRSYEALKENITWADDLCKKLGENKIESYLSLNDKKDEAFNLGNETYGDGSYVVSDIENNGKKKKIYDINHSSGRGAGCEINSYLLEEDPNGIVTANDQSHEIKTSKLSENFYAAQQSTCTDGVSPKILRYNGFDLLEMDNPDHPERKRQVWLFKNDKSIPLCRFDYKITASVSY